LNYFSSAPTIDNYSNELGRSLDNMSIRKPEISSNVRHTDLQADKND